MLVLSGLRWFDYGVKHEQHGILCLTTERDEPKPENIRATVGKAGYKISVSSVAYIIPTRQRELEFRLQWRAAPRNLDVPPFLKELLSDPHVLSAQWKVS
jgi:hypothetical protein